MRIDLPQCGFKNCKFNFDGNCNSRLEYERCDANHALMMLERLIMDHGLCWLCQCEQCKNRGSYKKCAEGCRPIWNGFYSSIRKGNKT